jgi:hypothetical protein
MVATNRAPALAFLLAVAAVGQARAQEHAHQGDAAATLRADMRRLWEDHITWTRNFIVSAAAGSADQQAVTERLLRNQTDIGNPNKPFYGDAAGTQLTALLRSHITTAAELVTAAKANDQARVTSTNNRWKANADSIATFLSTANRQNWPEATLKTEMARHLELTLNEATAQLRGDWAGSIRAYDEVHDQILRMADMLSTGITRQFPNRFAAR